MKNFTWLKKCIVWGVTMVVLTPLSGCSNTFTWQEEVKLSDGRIITVTQKRRYEGAYNGQNYGVIPREAWLTFKLPEFGDQDITWHENLKPWVLNLHEGKLYVVGWPPTGLEFDQYGQQRPPYFGFLYESGQWRRISFAEIPEAIYDTNMWIENAPKNKSEHVSLKDKAEELQDRELYRCCGRINPKHKTNL